MSINLKEMTLAELEALQADVAEQIAITREATKQKAMDAAKAAAEAAGFTIEDLFGNLKQDKPATKGKRAPAEPKYAHPENPETTWTGRGRQPVWFAELMAAGTSKEDLLINK
jgi:DNA-binding protein H-NS